MRTRTRLPVGVVVVVLCVIALATPASANPAKEAVRDTSFASFQGRMIDLSKSWEGAEVCAVVSRSDVRCYASREESIVALAPTTAINGGAQNTDGTVGLLSWNGCANGWLCIYEHASYGGRQLSFNDEYWHDLDEWGFKDQTSSWTNNQGGWVFGCSGSDSGTLGDGAGDNRTMTDCTEASNLGSYNDRTEDIHG
ncbi:peptidase inhibitor family I36 protein [Polymorphospora lycopeni]|uniref:Peptidase inhibitor family I36 protein n=1 Tax=Polymorphospora lycopeni TaxID=3140240 RepID=A0ABV5D0M0_9ACTN